MTLSVSLSLKKRFWIAITVNERNPSVVVQIPFVRRIERPLNVVFPCICEKQGTRVCNYFQGMFRTLLLSRVSWFVYTYVSKLTIMILQLNNDINSEKNIRGYYFSIRRFDRWYSFVFHEYKLVCTFILFPKVFLLRWIWSLTLGLFRFYYTLFF